MSDYKQDKIKKFPDGQSCELWEVINCVCFKPLILDGLWWMTRELIDTFLNLIQSERLSNKLVLFKLEQRESHVAYSHTEYFQYPAYVNIQECEKALCLNFCSH